MATRTQYPQSPLLIEARQLFEDGIISFEVYQAFRSHVHAAKSRGIGFFFTIDRWWAWWQTDDRWQRRGIGKNKLVMARKGDAGPYSPENVFCCTHSQNIQLIDPAKMSASQLAASARRKRLPGYNHHLSVRGDGHPRSRAVITPIGRFGSAAVAADAHGLTRHGAALRAEQQRNGWCYEQD
jgi:hypothetical protein